jgi:Protein of unknown function (DUF3307)
MSSNQIVLTLCVVFQFKHFIADYPLQNAYMLGKFKRKGWVLPLLAHSSVHCLFTFAITYGITLNAVLALWLSLFDGLCHTIMDRIKAHPDLLGRFKALSSGEYVYLKELEAMDEKLGNPKDRLIEHQFRNNKLFWWALGFDQLVHHLTDVAIIYFIVRGL